MLETDCNLDHDLSSRKKKKQKGKDEMMQQDRNPYFSLHGI